MKDVKRKMKMLPGVKYKGYGMLNEYGEITFELIQPGVPNPNSMKIVCEGPNTTLYESKNYWKASVRVPKLCDKNDTILQFTRYMWTVVQMLHKYISTGEVIQFNKNKKQKNEKTSKDKESMPEPFGY